MLEMGTELRQTCGGTCLDVTTESHLLMTRPSKCKQPKDFRPWKLNIHVYACLYTVSREQLKFKLEELIQLYLVLNTMGYHLKICIISYDDVMNSIQFYKI
jgi:hypothetical protein